MVLPEEAGIGAAPASRANAASEVMRPWCDQESTSCAAACGPTPGWSSSCGASLRVNVSISRASSRSSSFSCRTRRAIERSASKLPRSSGSRLPSGRVAASRCKSRARVSGRNSPVAARGRDQQVSQLAETGTLSVDRAFPCGHQRLQRLAFTACPWRRGPLVGEHAAGGTDRVERVGLAARTALPPQSADLEHPLAATGEETREAGTEGAGAFDSEDSTTRSVLFDERKALPVAVAVCDNVASNTTVPLTTSRPRAHASRGEGRHQRRSPTDLRASVTDLQPSVGGHIRCRSGVETAGGRTVTGHALTTRTGF